MEKYFYLLGVLLCVPLWLAMFLRSNHRRDMVLFGVIFGLGAVVLGFFYARFDYWHPSYIISGIYLEDFLYGFVFGGISTEIAEFLMGKANPKKPTYPAREQFVLIFCIVTMVCFMVLVEVLNLNSIWAHIMSPLLVGVIISLMRHDLFKVSVVSGLMIMILAFLMLSALRIIFTTPVFYEHWQMDNLLGIFVLGIPLEELLFAFALGFGAANVYEFISGYSLVEKRKSKTLRRLKK